MVLWSLHFLSTWDKTRVIMEERTSAGIASIKLACGHVQWFEGEGVPWLLIDVGGSRSQCGAGKIVLRCIRKQTELAMKKKLGNRSPLWPQIQFMPPGSCPVFPVQWAIIWKPKNPLSCPGCFGLLFSTTTETKLRYVSLSLLTWGLPEGVSGT